jgi:hypothetical protein
MIWELGMKARKQFLFCNYLYPSTVMPLACWRVEESWCYAGNSESLTLGTHVLTTCADVSTGKWFRKSYHSWSRFMFLITRLPWFLSHALENSVHNLSLLHFMGPIALDFRSYSTYVTYISRSAFNHRHVEFPLSINAVATIYLSLLRSQHCYSHLIILGS